MKLEIESAIPSARGSAFDVKFDPRDQRVNWVRSTTPCWLIILWLAEYLPFQCGIIHVSLFDLKMDYCYFVCAVISDNVCLMAHSALLECYGLGLVPHSIGNTVDLVIFACLYLREFLILGLFPKFRVREFFFFFSGAIIIIFFARLYNYRMCPPRDVRKNYQCYSVRLYAYFRSI